ncbi:MAG TPA: transcriptional regulator [Prevotella sp.]|nr:transcriptional regulator [Candidatus Segatella violae]
MVFSEYIKSLPSPRTEIVGKIAQRCKVSNVSVYRWIRETAKPSPLCRSIIAEVLNKPEAELFPDSLWNQ